MARQTAARNIQTAFRQYRVVKGEERRRINATLNEVRERGLGDRTRFRCDVLWSSTRYIIECIHDCVMYTQVRERSATRIQAMLRGSILRIHVARRKIMEETMQRQRINGTIFSKVLCTLTSYSKYDTILGTEL